MRFGKSTLRLLLLGVAATAIGSASAQTAVFRSATVGTGKAMRFAIVTALKRDCSLGDIGGVRVVTAPKNGSLVVKSGKLKTPATFRCPNVETPVQGLFYQSNPNYAGPDEIAYETRTPEGVTETFTVRITVQKTAPTSGSKGIQDL